MDIFKRIKTKAHNEGFRLGYAAAIEARREGNVGFRFLEENQFVGHRCIALSNEWANPIVGIGLRVDIADHDTPKLIIHDYITNMEIVCNHGSRKRVYTRPRLDAILKLDKYELMAIMYGSVSSADNKHIEERLSNDEIYAALLKNGFDLS